MEAITLYPENKDQERALIALSKAFKITIEKKSLIARLHELEEILDKIEIEAARKEPFRSWEEIKNNLDEKYGISKV